MRNATFAKTPFMFYRSDTDNQAVAGMTFSTIDPEHELTERQEAVLHALVRRTPIKQIAHDQGIAPSTVNDHIKAIKRKYGFDSTAELVAHFVGTLESSPSLANPAPSNGGETKLRMPETAPVRKEWGRGHTEALALSDSMAFSFEAPWAGVREPRVVPEELDGPGATVPRLIAIGKTVALILATIVLAIMALETVDGLVIGGATSGN